jgi:hypothetical protein
MKKEVTRERSKEPKGSKGAEPLGHFLAAALQAEKGGGCFAVNKGIMQPYKVRRRRFEQGIRTL